MNLNSNLAATHPGWIITMIIGFVLWWPIGLLILAYILWSGSMGRVNGQWFERIKDALGLHSGNAAFDAHKEATLRDLEKQRQKLEEQERDFRVFIDKARMAKDQSDFERFMNGRKKA